MRNKLWRACARCGLHKVDACCATCNSTISISIGPTSTTGVGIFLPGADFSQARQLLTKGKCIRAAVLAELDRDYARPRDMRMGPG